jgi:hypothetical protein
MDKIDTDITKALGLSEDASKVQILERISDLKRAAGDEDEEERDAIQRIEQNEHEQVRLNEDGSLLVTLLYPLKSGTETVDEITMRRPKFKHLREMDKFEGRVAKSQALIAAVSNRSVKELNELDQADLLVLNACLGFFSARPRRTGAAS